MSRVIGVPPKTRLFRIERVASGWRVWIAANADYSQGTFLLLHNDGSAQRITINPDGSDEEFDIKPKDAST